MGYKDEIRKVQEWKAMLRDIVGDIDNGCYEPTEWETDFLNSIDDRLAQGASLTEGQDRALEKIWNKTRSGS